MVCSLIWYVHGLIPTPFYQMFEEEMENYQPICEGQGLGMGSHSTTT
jgi:hypothetical protein